MESVNILEGADRFPSTEPIAVAEANIARAAATKTVEVAANTIARFITATNNVNKDLIFTKNITNASTNKAITAQFDGLAKFLAAIAAEAAAKLAEAKAAGTAVEVAAATAKEAARAAEIAAEDVTEEIDDAEIASDNTKSIIERAVAKCITALNETAETTGIAQATTEAATANKSVSAFVNVVFAKVVFKEARVRLREAQNTREGLVALATFKQFTDMVRTLKEEEEEGLELEEEIARTSDTEGVGPPAAASSPAETSPCSLARRQICRGA